LDADLVNLSQAGAGNVFICDATISELSQRKYDFVAIMWADLRRFDIKIANVEKFNDTIYTSKYQKIMNDWPEKIVEPINDQDYVDDDWAFGCGYLNTKDKSMVDLFDSYYKNTNVASQYYTGYCRILALQGFLKSINQPYVFMSTRVLTPLDRFEHLYNMIDFDHYIGEPTVFELAKQMDSWQDDKIHPGPLAQMAYANYLLNEIQKRNLLSR
jgi:hypothetical protein